MAYYYLDASAAVKGYVEERGSDRIVALLDRAAEHELYISRICIVEVAAGILGKVRTGEAAFEEAVSYVRVFLGDLEDMYQVVEVDAVTTEKAVEVAQNHLLRAYDCLQLATVPLLQEQRDLAGMEPLTLMSSDVELNAAAEAEGLAVENPVD